MLTPAGAVAWPTPLSPQPTIKEFVVGPTELTGRLVKPAPLPTKPPAVTVPVNVWFALSRAMLAESWLSAIVPVRLPDGTLLNPAPLPLNTLAVSEPAKAALPFSSATLDERRASGTVPARAEASRFTSPPPLPLKFPATTLFTLVSRLTPLK